MAVNQVMAVSKIVKTVSEDKKVGYGFTVTYSDGKIKNIIRYNVCEDGSDTLSQVQNERSKYIVKMETGNSSKIVYMSTK